MLIFEDRMRWYCEKGAHAEPTIIYETALHIYDLGVQLKPVIEKWMADPELRRCKICGEVADAK